MTKKKDVRNFGENRREIFQDFFSENIFSKNFCPPNICDPNFCPPIFITSLRRWIRLLSDGCNGATCQSCGHQTRLMFSCLEPRLKWVIGPFRSLVHLFGTVFLQLFWNQNPSCFQK